MKLPVIEVYQGVAAELKVLWYWRLRAKNGEIVADGAEGYVRRANAIRAARRVKEMMAEAVTPK